LEADVYEPGVGRISPPGIRTYPSGTFTTVAGSSTTIGEYGRGCKPPLISPGGLVSRATAETDSFAGAAVSFFEPINAPIASVAAISTMAKNTIQALLSARLPDPRLSILVAIDLASFR
jgi:hypothetical protein